MSGCDKSIHEFFMRQALVEAENCASFDEVPVGAIIVRHGEVIAASGNKRECEKDATSHAEMCAISEACRRLGGWHLTDCTLYVTLEPCPMCAGAILNSRIDTVVYGANDQKNGALGSAVDLSQMASNHRPEVISGVLADECAEVLKRFFKEKRERGERWGSKSNKSE